ncbi:hypothetical protein KJ835_02570 [Patescibacteria group bacterium]|nr:hypothetical protein [Patescibacteria group bacterium]
MVAKKKTPKKASPKHGGGMLLSIALSAALAAAAGYYATHKQEVDKEAKKRIDQLAKAYKETRPKVEKRVKEVWGEVSDEAVAVYMDVRGLVLHSLEEENLKKTGKMLRAQYDHVVEAAVEEARKSGLLNKDIEKKLEHLFKMDWKEVQAILGKSAKRVAKVAQKEAKKMVKNVAKKTAKRPVKKPAPKKAARKPARKVVKKAVKKPAKKRT